MRHEPLVPAPVRVNGVCEPLIGAKEAAAILDSSPTKIKRMAAAGEVPAIQIGNRWKFRASWLNEWLDRQVQLARHPRPSSPVEVQ